MRISYAREMNHNYLVISEGEASGFEVEMLLQNHIRGLLHMHITQLDGETSYYYDITSKQPLSRMLESSSLQKKEICALIEGITTAFSQMEPYLLSAEQVLLEPEYLYLQPDSYEVSLCLVPGSTQDFQTSLRRVLQAMMEKVDHQDKESVIAMYGLYQESLKDNCSMEDLCRYLAGTGSRSQPEVVRQEPEQKFDIREDYRSPEPMRIADGALAYGKPVRKNPMEWIRSMLRGGGHPGKEEVSELDQLDQLFQETSLDRESLQGQHPEHQGQYFYGNTVDTAEAESNTVLLGHGMSQGTASCRRLTSLDQSNPDIDLHYYPFLVGKQENLVDYILDRPSISRLHIRIDRDGEHYRITDLNSTNGTKVRGEMLTNNESTELYPGDQVMIAELPYMFL